MKALLSYAWKRWWTRCLIALAILFGIAMAFVLPRDFVFGPRGDVLPASLWAYWIRSHAANHHSGFESGLIEFLYLVRHGPHAKHTFEPYNRLLHQLPSDRNISVLIELADDDDEKVRALCLSRLGYVTPEGADRVLPVLRGHLRDDDSKCRLESSHGVWRLGKGRQAIEVLIELSESQDQQIRIGAISFLGEACNDIPQLFDHFAKLLDHKDPVTRAFAMDRMRDFGKQAVPMVRKGLADADSRVRRSALHTAMRLKTDAADLLQDLRALCRDPDGLVVQEANAKLPAFERGIFAKGK